MRTNTLRIRRYVDADHEQMWNLHNLALDDVGAHAGNGPWDDDLHKIDEVYLRGGEFLLGFLDRQIVAMGALKKTSDDRAEIKRIRVHPEHQRQGFGQSILLALENHAAELCFSVVHLDTTIQQPAAQALYVQNAYTELCRKQLGAFECIFFEKQLGLIESE